MCLKNLSRESQLLPGRECLAEFLHVRIVYVTAIFHIRNMKHIMLDLPVNIHPCHLRFTVTLHHAEKLPAVTLIKTDMISD